MKEKSAIVCKAWSSHVVYPGRESKQDIRESEGAKCANLYSKRMSKGRDIQAGA